MCGRRQAGPKACCTAKRGCLPLIQGPFPSLTMQYKAVPAPLSRSVQMVLRFVQGVLTMVQEAQSACACSAGRHQGRAVLGIFTVKKLPAHQILSRAQAQCYLGAACASKCMQASWSTCLRASQEAQQGDQQ